MKIPIYVVTGLLDSGKTTFIQSMLNRNSNQEKKVLVLEFEQGEKHLTKVTHSYAIVTYEIYKVEKERKQISESICHYIKVMNPDEIWVEWNGMLSFQLLERIFLETEIVSYGKIQKVIYIGREPMLKAMLGKTGDAPLSQVRNSDVAYLWEKTGIKGSVLAKINHRLRIYSKAESIALTKEIYNRYFIHSGGYFVLSCILIVLLVTTPILEQFGGSTNRLITNFVGIMLQALPFLLIGVLLSSFIQIYVSQDRMEKIFSKNKGMGMLAAIGFGFCIPVCDCTSIPVFKSLVKKGVPLSQAITFMTVSPVINPVVILSTYYAFQGDLRVVGTRVLLGMICATCIGLSFLIHPPTEFMKEDGRLLPNCDCGCDINMPENKEGGKLRKQQFHLFVRHSQMEFFLVGRYLMYGAFISVLLQMFDTNVLFTRVGNHFVLQLIVMMGLAFVFSLCSSSDAIVAKSYTLKFMPGAIMGFLVFGPMMDLKNIMMLSSSFSKRFVWRLFLTTLVVCFVVICIFYLSGIGGVIR